MCVPILLYEFPIGFSISSSCVFNVFAGFLELFISFLCVPILLYEFPTSFLSVSHLFSTVFSTLLGVFSQLLIRFFRCSSVSSVLSWTGQGTFHET